MDSSDEVDRGGDGPPTPEVEAEVEMTVTKEASIPIAAHETVARDATVLFGLMVYTSSSQPRRWLLQARQMLTMTSRRNLRLS
jgi:hypothetical protein